MPLISIIIPAYNEAKIIKPVLEKINSSAIDKEIIVVDDGSTDDTSHILRELNFGNLKVIHHTTKRGKAQAIQTGVSLAASELVLIQEPKAPDDPDDYVKLFEAGKSKETLVLGVTKKRGCAALANFFARILIRLSFNLRLKDCLSDYMLMPKDAASKSDFRSKGFSLHLGIIANAVQKGLRIIEVSLYQNED